MNTQKRLGIFFLTLLIEIIFLTITYHILTTMPKNINDYYILMVVCVCFLLMLTQLYKHLVYKKLDINLNKDIIFIFVVSLGFWFSIPILGAVIFRIFHFYILAAYLVLNLFIWGIKKYIEKRDIKKHIENIKEKTEIDV